MANVGRGKALFRQYSKMVNALYRDLSDDISNGEEYFSDDIDEQFNQIFVAFETDLIDINAPNQELWRQRLSQEITRQITRIYDKFGEPEEREPEPEPEPEPDETHVDEERGVIVIQGDEYPIIDRSNAPTLRRGGRKPRNRVFRTLDEVEAYLYDKEWPREYVYQYGGIEILYRSGKVVGYRIWIG